jgi:hypothetical protein
MTTDATSGIPQYRTSPRARRIAVCVLAAVVIGHLSLLTYSLFDRIATTRVAVLIIVLWSLSALALVLLARAWRQTRIS